MQRNNTYDIAKCWAIVSVIVYHVITLYSIIKLYIHLSTLIF